MNFYFDKIYNKLCIAFHTLFPYFKNSEEKRLTAILTNNHPIDIVFVCTGNICRSAFAEYYTKSRIKELESVSSAGVYTNPGKPADAKAIENALRYGIDMKAHKTTTIESIPKSKNKLYLIFEPIHGLYLRKQKKFDSNVIIYVGSFCKTPTIYIRDPYGKSDEVFKEVFDQIIEACDSLIESVNNQKIQRSTN